MQELNSAVRVPWKAVALSLATPGLGQLYCGRLRPALLLMVASSLPLSAWIVTATLPPATPLLMLLLALIPGVAAVSIYALADAYFLARRLGADYRLNRYNRTTVYATFFVLGWILAAGVGLLVKEQCFEAFHIVSNSMHRTLLPGDFLLANNRILSDRPPRLGDVVVFRDPTDAKRRLVKRVIAGPGDTVEIRGFEVYVNGDMLTYSKGVPTTEAADTTEWRERSGEVAYSIRVAGSSPGDDLAQMRLPEDHFFMLGDNRLRSRDSRGFGPVSRTDFVGVVQYIYLPGGFTWDRFGAVLGN